MAAKQRSKPPAPESREVAASGGQADIGASYVTALGLLAPEDPLLAAKGGNLKLYEEIARDGRVFSTFQQRRLAVVAREWRVDAGGDAPIDKAAAAHLEQVLKAIPFDRASMKMHFGVFYGYAVGEILWGVGDDGLYNISAIKVRKSRRFAFGKDQRLRMLTKDSPSGVELPERKFWTFSAGSEDDDDPYGRGLGYWLYWPVWFKRNGVRFWAQFLEKFGEPTAVGTYPRNTSLEDIKKFLVSLRRMQRSAALAMPDGMEAKLLEAGKNAGDQEAFVKAMDKEITQIVLSQTMTTEDGSSRAQGEVHFDVRQEVAKSDADLICESFNSGPARWLTEWNFPGAQIPRVYRDFSEPEDLGKVVERDARLLDMGYEPDDEYIQETYGKHWTRKQKEAPADQMGKPGKPPLPPPPEPEAAFAEEPHLAPDAIDEAAAFMLSEWEQLVGPAVAQIEAEFVQASNYDDLVGRLVALAPALDMAALNEAIARAGFSARAAGLAGEALSDAEEGA